MNIIKTILFFCTIGLISCKSDSSGLDYEKDVMQELFLELIDSLHYEPHYIPPPPVPLPELYFKTTNQNLRDSILKKDSIDRVAFLYEFNQRVEKIKGYTGRKVIAIFDSIDNLDGRECEMLKDQFDGVECSIFNSKRYKFDLTKYSTNSNYELKYSSEFPRGNEKWQNNHETHLLNVISFSRIQFDRSRTYGVLTGGISFGKLSGNGFIVFIKNNNNKWTIFKIIDTWVS